METIIRDRGSDFLGQIARRPRKEESRKAIQYIFKEGDYAETGLGDDWLLEHGAESVLRYIDSPGARSLGVGSGRTRRQIEDGIAEYQAKQKAGPLRVPADLTTEIETLVEHAVDADDQMQRSEAQKQININQGRAYLNREVDNRIERLLEESNELLTRAADLTDELNRLPRELDVLNTAINNRFAAQPPGSPKTRAEVEQEVRTEYEQRYRAPIINQLQQEGPLIQWFADNSGGALSRDQAEQERIAQLYERLHLGATTPPVTPAPKVKERKIFEDIARGIVPLPPARDKQQERKLAGSLQESLRFVQQIEQEVNRLSQEIQEMAVRGEDASTQENARARWQSQLDSANMKMNEIRRELNLTP